MNNFKEWLDEEELSENKWGLLGTAAMALGSMFPGTSQGQGTIQPQQTQAGEVHHFANDALVHLGKSNRQMDADEIFIKVWEKYKNQFTANMKAKPYITEFYMSVATVEENGQKKALVKIGAEILAPNREQAKRMLIAEIMRETGKLNMQGVAIKALKDMMQTMDVVEQQQGQKIKLQLTITPHTAYWG